MTRDEARLPEFLEDELAEILFRAPEQAAQRVRELAELHPQHADALLERARDCGLECADALAEHDRIGPYRVLRELGEGGFGMVYLAESPAPNKRRVAVKVLKLGMDSRRVLRAFEQEHRVLAAMDHPCVATVLDAGTTRSGRAYFVMEFIEGTSLTAFCDEHGLDARARIELFQDVCKGVQHAHQKAVIHRDLKPGNILVTTREGAPVPRIIDFGMARALDPDLGGGWSSSRIGDRLGTLHYMSPEQLAQHRVLRPGQTLDTRSDVYSLGVVLYELLTGRVPFPKEPDTTAAELEVQILEEAPARPSLLAGRPFSGSLSSDLDWIVLRALEKDPDRRYATPLDLARDLGRCLEHQPVEARPPTRVYKLRKFARRNRAAVAAGALVSLSLIAGTIGTGAGFLEAKRQTGRALKERDAADRVASFHVGQLRGIDLSSLGTDLRARLVQKVRAARGEGIDEERLEEHVAELERAIAGADFTGLALETLDTAVFQPALAEIGERFTDDPLLEAELQQTVARTLLELGLVQSARAPQERAVALRRELLGESDAERLSSEAFQAELYYALGETERAIELADRIVAVRSREMGPTATETVKAIDDRGRYLFALGETEAARQVHEKTYAAFLATLGEDAPYTRAAMNNLAGTLGKLGELEAALALQERTLAIELREHGELHERAVAARNNLAITLAALGQNERARELYEQTLAALAQTAGDLHPYTLNTLYNLSSALRKLGLLDEALQIARRVLDGRTRVLGPHHVDTSKARSRVGHILFLQDDLAAACELEREALAGFREHFGDRHEDTLQIMMNLAGTLYMMNELERARELQEYVVDVFLTDYGEQHPSLPVAMTNLARLLRFRGELETARTWAERALTLCRANPRLGAVDCGPIEKLLASIAASEAAAGSG